MPFPVSVPQCAVILRKTNRLEQKGGEGCCFVRAYVWRTHPFLSHEGCRATRLKDCQSALLNARVFLQKQERREIAKGGWRGVREKRSEWRHCGGDRGVIWVRWTEWWYVNKRVTDTKETERARDGGEESQLCSIWHLCRKHLASLSITGAQLIDFLLFSIRFLRGSCFFSFFVCLTAFLPHLFTAQALARSKISPYPLARINQSHKLDTW